MQKKRGIQFFFAILIGWMALFCLPAGYAYASQKEADAPLSMDVSYGFDNTAKSDRYLRVTVLLNNDTAPFEGTLEFLTAQSSLEAYQYSYPLSLVAGEKFEQEYYIPLGVRADQMFVSVQDLIILGIGCISLIIWLGIFIAAKKYDELFEPLDEKEYALKELYSMGYFVMEKLKYNYKSRRDRKLRQDMEVLYEKKYVEYYLRVTYSRAVTYGMLLFVLAFVVYGLSGEMGVLWVMFMFSGVSVYYVMTLAPKKIEARSAALLGDFSEVVSKLALLTNAGMILREAWELTANAGEGIFYEEMQTAVAEMKNGVSEMEAIRRFGIRCMMPEIKKFSATVIQGIQKGNSELSSMLQAQSAEVWNLRKQNVRRQGEKAASKLMIPIFMMFFGILIMVIIPIFSNIGV